MAFIKRGDGKIVSVLTEKDLLEDQKKKVSEQINEHLIKEDLPTDPSDEEKKSGS